MGGSLDEALFDVLGAGGDSSPAPNESVALQSIIGEAMETGGNSHIKTPIGMYSNAAVMMSRRRRDHLR